MSLDVIAFLEINFDKVKSVDTVVGEYRVSPCPNCGNSKLKLYVNSEQEVFHCFVCDYGRGERISKLMKDMGCDPSDYDLGDDSYIPDPVQPKPVTDLPKKKLPEAYRQLIGNNSIGARQALAYIRGRGISDNIISLFDIGYCFEGKYKNRILIPYYEKGQLVYFVTRDITNRANQKYLNAEWEKHTFLFNYERASKYGFVLVVEGAVDVFALPEHSICLLGKTISPEQRDLLKRFKRIYILMDGDALRDAYARCDELGEAFDGRLYIVELPVGKDPFDVRDKIPSMLEEATLYNKEAHSQFRISNEKPTKAQAVQTTQSNDMWDCVPFELKETILNGR